MSLTSWNGFKLAQNQFETSLNRFGVGLEHVLFLGLATFLKFGYFLSDNTVFFVNKQTSALLQRVKFQIC